MTSASDSLELSIGGMTCASCAARIEKKLNRMDGVSATVNYATEKAKVAFRRGLRRRLVAIVEATGYTAAMPKPLARRATQTSPCAGAGGRRPGPVASLRRGSCVALVLSVPVFALAMAPRCSSTTGSGCR